MSITTDKAYIFGLVIGGGVFGNAEDTFFINLPYRQWGSYEQNPQRASQISRDIMQTVSPMFRTIYSVSISFDATPRGTWRILCEGNLSELKADLQSFGVTCEGDLRVNVDISGIVANLVDDFAKRRFIAGLADTIGSTTKSHRRFSNEVQILSFELKGFNFGFICEMCRLLYSVKCFPDQILWNHPNFHAASNCYYTSWTKGHKLRVQLDQYAEFGAFAFTTKAEAVAENRRLQYQSHVAVPCPDREVRATVSCVHPAEHDRRLPDTIRGGHYLHNRHVCAVLGCEHAPYEAVKRLFDSVGDLVVPFPIVCKYDFLHIEMIIDTDPLLKNRNYRTSLVSVESFYQELQSDRNTLLHGNSVDSGYLITDVMQGIAYCIAADDELNGTRIKGNYVELIERHLKADSNPMVEIRVPDLLTPLVITGNGRGVLIGARNPKVYQKLVSTALDNEYKLLVRQITEDDLL